MFSEIKTLSSQQKRLKEHKSLTEEASVVAKTPFLMLKVVGPIESTYLNDMKLTPNPMKDGLYSMIRFAAIHSRDTSASAFCKMLLEKDVSEKTLLDVFYYLYSFFHPPTHIFYLLFQFFNSMTL